jgi:hypothetical protein
MKLLWLVAVLFVPVSLVGQRPSGGNMNALAAKMKSGIVRRVEVLRMPDNVTTIVAVSQDTLRKSPSYSIVLNNGFEPSLQSLLTGVSTLKSGKPSDLRWGLLLFDSSGHEIDSLFVDHFGMTGYLDGQSVQFSENMSKRMRTFVQELR